MYVIIRYYHKPSYCLLSIQRQFLKGCPTHLMRGCIVIREYHATEVTTPVSQNYH